MIEQANFQVSDKISESKNTIVFRAIQVSDGKKLILKLPKAEFPGIEALSRLRREFEIIQTLNNVTGVITVFELIPDNNTLILTEEDFGADSLEQVLKKGPIDLATGLNIAIQLSQTIAHIHQHNIIHKDINPSNILWHEERQELKLIDFGISSLLSQEYQDFENPDQLEGSFPYLSPEQTGRINRILDYRSDLYSLGITLYQMFTGQLPFTGHQGIEFVHAHIAQKPVPPHKSNKSIPEVLSKIILKLINKMAEDRYQSAWGASLDLERCLEQLVRKNTIDDFTLATRDFSPVLQIPQKLYGREHETTQILNAFARVSRGSTELLLISGYSGTGKSSLVQEVHKSLTEKRGLYISGKFDQYRLDVPFFAWRRAIEAFSHLLLKENETSLALWRKKISNALGNIGKVITDLAPSLELIIGTQPEVPLLTGEQALSRFNYAFSVFLNAVSTREHPLVIFLDDWQWADMASINLLEYIMSEVDNQFILIISAWRDNEIDTAHPFTLALNSIKESNAQVNRIEVKNLDIQHIHEFVSDALKQSKDIENLVQLFYRKTHGNAFFLIRFLKNLYNEALLTVDVKNQCWNWNLSQIKEKNITDNVVSLMADTIAKLDAGTCKTLQFAACIGNRFDLNTLAIILGQTTKNVAYTLKPALHEGIIKPLNKKYRFAEYQENNDDVMYQFIHDRVQQAAYSLLDEKQRQMAHLDIGKNLLNNLNEEQLYTRIFEIVNHLNIAREQVNDHQLLLSLNLIAGKKARAATAFTPALHYFKTAIRYLSDNAWHQDHQRTAELYLMAAEAAFMAKQYDPMERWLELYLQHARTPLAQADAYEIRLQAYISQNRLNDAVDISLYALKLLGVNLPRQPSQLNVLINLFRTKWVLKNKTFDDLLNLPEMTDPVKLKIMRLLGLTIPPAYWTSQELVTLTVLQMLRESVAYGYSPNTGYAFSWWGITLGAVLNDLEKGFEFGEFGVTIAKTHDLDLPRPLFFQGWITHQFKHPIKDSIELLNQSYHLAMEKGDIEYASYSLNNFMQAQFHSGQPLPELMEKMKQSHRDLESFKVGSSQFWHDICWQTIINFNAPDTSTELKGDAYNEEQNVPQHLKVNDASTLFLLYCAKLMLSVFFDDKDNAIKFSQKTRQYLKGGIGMYAYILFHFYETLTLLSRAEKASFIQRKGLLKQASGNIKKLRTWATYSPGNHLHRLHFLEAEYCHSIGDDGQAAQLYDQAIDEARNNGYLHDEALVCEFTARFYNHRQQNRLSSLYIRQSYNAYNQWGSTAKIKQLQKRYPHWLTYIENTPEQSNAFDTHTPVSSTGETSSELDMTTLVKAYNSISSTIVLTDLIKNLLSYAIENAGAQKGCLILKRDNHLMLEAKGTINDEIVVLQSLPIEQASKILPLSIVYYVEHSLKPVVIDDFKQSEQFLQDIYLDESAPISVLCEPILNQGQLSGILYLENNLTQGAFSKKQLKLLEMLMSQAAISIENSILYSQLEHKVHNRTIELQESLKTQQSLNDELLAKGQKLDEANDELFRANEQLQLQANTDVLTGLSNRRYFNELIEHEYHRCIREKHFLCVLMADIDHFKAYNDRYGHLEGDRCIKQVSSVLQSVFNRSIDLVARYGGEEFIVVLSSTEPEEAQKMADSLRLKIVELNIPHEGNVDYGVVTMSIGGYCLKPSGEQGIDSIIQQSDALLYKAKQEGRNCIKFSS